MLKGLRKRRQNREVVDRLYEMIVERARRPALYTQGGLPDTVMGRFEALGLEVFLFLDRCRGDGALSALSQDLVDRFMIDLDHSIRELGVGYLAVPKRMRKLAGQFYGRVDALKAPLEARDLAGLEAAIRATVFAGAEPVPATAPAFVARHLVATADELANWRSDEILAAREPQAEGRVPDAAV